MANPFSYESQHVVVTGGASGVGAALLELLAEIGRPRVTVLDVKPPTGPHARFVETDLSRSGSVDAAIDAIDEPVDALFNNAGVAATQPPLVVLAVNYLAVRRLSERLLARIPRGGAIVNTASTAGGGWKTHLGPILELLAIDDWDRSLEWIGTNLPLVGGDSYVFSKEVVRVWSMQSSRATMAAGVRTNCVCPGPIDTPLLEDFKVTMDEEMLEWTARHGTGAYTTAREVAMPLAFLGSEAAAYVNGHELLVDGGVRAALATGQLQLPAS
jgi:NAD(P)-dependent dehydrogenase (short-subunit alcohol dehydrogenase family)